MTWIGSPAYRPQFPTVRPSPARQPVGGSVPVAPSAVPAVPSAPAAPEGLWGAVTSLWGWARRLVQGPTAGTVPVQVSGPGKYREPVGGGASTVTVESGDSLSAIAQRELGDGNRWGEIFDLNRDQLDDPNMIFPGQVLKLPGGDAPAPAPAPAPAAPATVTVQPGQTLGRIAAETLGDANRWREIFDANRDQISNPNLIFPGMVLRVPGGANAPAPAPAPAPAGDFGGRVVDAARQLMASGYHYPPDLSANYYHRRFEVGCCADFACDAWTRAGVDIYQEMVNGGYNPHYCPSQVKFFLDSPTHTLLAPDKPAQVGDFVFFNWSGGTEADHVAIVSEVDGNGRPTKIVESYNFNLPVRERAVGSSAGCIVGFGRL
jgi:nucleoid-associated protein YgaU